MLKFVVLSCLVAVGSAALLGPFGAPLIYSPYSYLSPYPSNYRGPLSLAPGQPANVLGSDGRPLDTLDVNLDRSAHYAAKALDGTGLHLLKKRSVVAAYSRLGLPAAPIYSHAAPYYSYTPLAYSSHYSAPIAAPLAAHLPLVHY